MSFFDSVKKSLGISKDKEKIEYEQFEVTFIEEKLGMGINKYSGPMPHLSRSSPGSSCPEITVVDRAVQAYGE